MKWYQKGKINLEFTEARDSECQLHQLGHMQVCTSLQTDNHVSTPPLRVTTIPTKSQKLRPRVKVLIPSLRDSALSRANPTLGDNGECGSLALWRGREPARVRRRLGSVGGFGVKQESKSTLDSLNFCDPAQKQTTAFCLTASFPGQPG